MATKEYEINLDKIIQQLDRRENIWRAPRTRELFEMLKMNWSEEEAAIGANMTIEPQSPEDIAKKVNMEKEKLIPILESLCDKILVFRSGEEGNYKYSLLMADPGIIGHHLDDEKAEEYSRLITTYHDNEWGKEITRRPDICRILPIEESASAGSEVLSFEKVSEIIENTSYFAIAKCPCKTQREIIGEPCKHNLPDYYVCIVLDDMARTIVERKFSGARQITKEEAYEILRKAKDAGLVQLIANFTGSTPGVICNCCSCCCLVLRPIYLFKDKSVLSPPNFLPVIDRKKCDGCKDLKEPVCVERCPMDTISIKDGKAFVNMKMCIGCGVCTYLCPTEGAITLKRLAKITEPKDLLKFSEYLASTP